MTVLRARALDSQGKPVAGRTAVLEPWTGNRYRSSYSGPSAVRGLTATSGSDGWMSWTLPNLLRRPGPRGALWMVTGLEAQPIVLATQPTDTTTTGTRVGTVSPLGDLVPTPVVPVDTAAQATAAAQAAVSTVTAGAPTSLDTLAEVAAELQGRLSDTVLRAALAPVTDVQVYSTPGQTVYWTKPPGARSVSVVAIGGGSGGGSGARRASGTATSGGGGGGGGAISMATFRANDLPTVCPVSVGQGGAGGAAVTVDDTNGAAGTGSGQAQISSFSGPGLLVRTTASTAGGGGGTAASTAGSGGQAAVPGGGGAAGTVGGAPPNSITANAGTGGGAGGGISTTPAAFAGSTGGTSSQRASVAAGGAIGAAGAGGAGGGPGLVPGGGGGGGGSSITGAGGSGGAAGAYGGAGGGGGSSLNGQPSGAGGPGGDGIVMVTTYCGVVGPESWAAYGDSLTAGAGGGATTYPSVVAAATGLVIANFGVGGEVSQQIAARAGARSVTIPAVTIPASGTVPVTPSPSVPSAQGLSVSGSLAGVRGTLEWNAGAPRFRRHEPGVAVATAGKPFVPDMARWADASGLLVWAGRNNLTETANVLADVAAIIARTRSGRYLVLSVLNQYGETSASGAYASIKAINDQLAATYGAHYLDIRRYLIDHGLADAGITPTTQDTTDIANDVVPTSLRSDSLHLNAAGYTVVGQQVAARMVSLGYV